MNKRSAPDAVRVEPGHFEKACFDAIAKVDAAKDAVIAANTPEERRKAERRLADAISGLDWI